MRAEAPVLARDGVRLVTLSTGVLGAPPRLLAYGPTVAAGPLASVSVPGPRWVSDCIISCRTTPDVSVLGYLGNVAESDPLFTTIVRIPGGLG
ncbi:MAG TPA: hypothetical protein VNR66_05680 [Solirubrobacteraceae bacterium]|nr:hypothetical protein [Solirubrobacteraceae bacterium]